MREIDRRWIVACLIAAIASAAEGFLDYAVREWLEAGGAETPFAVTAIYAAVSAVLNAGSAAVYAWATAAVLRLIAPALPRRQWMVLHLAIGAVVGIGTALIYSAPTGEPNDWSDAEFIGLIPLALLFVAACALVGVVLGSLEALVLRRAAQGMRSWIVISALATAIIGLAMIPFLLLYEQDGTFAREAMDRGVIFVASIVAASAMLPALHRLRPRAA